MAVPADLNRPARRRLLAVVAVVLLAHVAALVGLSRWQDQKRLLKPMVAPLYTRVLQPEPPPQPPQVVAQATPAPPPAPAARMRATPSVPAQNTATVPQPPPERAPEPEPEPAPVPIAEPAPDATLAPEPEPPSAPAAQATPPAEVASAPETPPEEAVAQAPEPSGPDSPHAQSPAPAPGVALDPAPAPPPPPPGSAPGTGADPTARPVDSWPSDTRLRYRLGGRFRSGDLYGDARVLWQREASRYQVRVEVTLTFLATLTMTSQGVVDAVTLRPEVYEEVRNGKPRVLRMGEHEVLLSSGKVVPRPPRMQDTASQFVELSHRFASGREKLEVGRTVSVWLARPGAVDLWTYDIVASEVLRTALGEVEAFHLKPRPIANPRGNITAEMWFAPSLQYLPVRIRVNMGDEAHLDLVVEAIDQR